MGEKWFSNIGGTPCCRCPGSPPGAAGVVLDTQRALSRHETGSMAPDRAWLAPTWFIDSDDPTVVAFADAAAGDATDQTQVAVRLFDAVRDGVRYDPYNGFADVRNHLTSEKWRAQMSSDVFAWHGCSEVLLDDRGPKLSTAFNIELGDRFGVKALDFDGTGDAVMHPFDMAGNRHMEYVRQRGTFDDLPLEQILADFADIYGDDMTSVNGRPGSAAAAGDDAFVS
jgi:hypothetical protein